MKKAYVKPVFLAEEYVAVASHVAGCGDASINKALIITPGQCVCDGGDGHSAGQGGKGNPAGISMMYNGKVNENKNTNSQYDYWEYAKENDGVSNLFSSNNFDCDFLWDYYSTGKDEIYVWESATAERNSFLGTIGAMLNGAVMTYARFFTNSNQGLNQHNPGYMGQSFQS